MSKGRLPFAAGAWPRPHAVRRCAERRAFINARRMGGECCALGLNVETASEIMAAIEAPCGKGMDDSDKRHIRPSASASLRPAVR